MIFRQNQNCGIVFLCGLVESELSLDFVCYLALKIRIRIGELSYTEGLAVYLSDK